MSEPITIPQVIEMEKFVLSSMLLKEGEIIPTVTAILTADDFYRPEHRMAFEAMINIYARKDIPNLLTLTEELRASGKLNDAGGIEFVLSLGNIAFTTAYTEIYCRTIKEKATLRRLIKIGEEIARDAYEAKKPLNNILDEAEQKILSISFQSDQAEFEHIESILQRAFERINKAINNPKGLTGVETDFTDLDKITSGFQSSDLILLAARPSMGKTALALNIAMNAALNNNIVAIFSLEMSKEQLGHRLLSSYSGINSQNLSTGNITNEDFDNLINTQEYIRKAKLFIDDTAGISVLELRSKARRIKNEHGLDFIVIDYLQLMQGSIVKGRDYNRQQEISEISRSLKSLARELKVPILALSQLSRSVEMRADKRPLLSDLRESGSLEQDADIVMFLYREEYYDQETENSNTAELIIAKNRNGPTANVKLQFDKECMRFASLAQYD